MSEPGPSRAVPPPPRFEPASEVARAQSGSAGQAAVGSLRNASNDQSSLSTAGSSNAGPGTGEANGEKEGTDGDAEATVPAGPVKPVHRSAASKKAIVYSAVQRRNPVLHAIRNVPTEIGDIVADYQVGTHNGVLFLSLKYHRLHPEYIHQRIEKMKKQYQLRILLILCDVSEHQVSIRELSKIAIINDFTTFVAWSNEEVAQYLATFKQYEHKSADTLKERVHQDYREQLVHVLTSGKKVNKGDAGTLASQFGSFANISRQPAKVLAGVKGLGPTKVTSLSDAFTKPFLVGGLKRPIDGSSTAAGMSGQKTPAVEEAAVSNAEHGSGKGKGRAINGSDSTADFNGGGNMEEEVEAVGSPDWPSDAENDGNEGDNPRPASPSPPPRRRGRSPSRSPGVSPEPRQGVGDSEPWRDPLEDEDDEQDESGSATATVGGKRRRMS